MGDIGWVTPCIVRKLIKGNFAEMETRGQKGELSHGTTSCQWQEGLSLTLYNRRIVNSKNYQI